MQVIRSKSCARGVNYVSSFSADSFTGFSFCFCFSFNVCCVYRIRKGSAESSRRSSPENAWVHGLVLTSESSTRAIVFKAQFGRRRHRSFWRMISQWFVFSCWAQQASIMEQEMACWYLYDEICTVYSVWRFCCALGRKPNRSRMKQRTEENTKGFHEVPWFVCWKWCETSGLIL